MLAGVAGAADMTSVEDVIWTSSSFGQTWGQKTHKHYTHTLNYNVYWGGWHLRSRARPPEEKNELFQGPNILLPLRLIMCKIQSWIQK